MVNQPDLPASAHLLLYRVLQKTMTLDITDLMVMDCVNTKSGPEPTIKVDYQFLDAKAFRQFASDPLNGLDIFLSARLSSGLDRCCAVTHGGELAGFAWFALASIESEHNRGSTPSTGVCLSFPRDTAFMYNTYVYPRFRGHGIYGSLVKQAATQLSLSSIRRILSTCDWTNWPALRSCYRIGFRKIGRIYRFGWDSQMFTVAPKKARRMDIHIGRRAALHGRAARTAHSTPAV